MRNRGLKNHWCLKVLTLTIFPLLFIIFSSHRAYSDGIMFSEAINKFLLLRSSKITVEINSQVAETTVEHSFLNDSANTISATYMFPLPENASATGFARFMDGKFVDFTIHVGPQVKSPALGSPERNKELEDFLGSNPFRTRVENIPSKEEVKVRLKYVELLTYDFGLIKYSYPLFSMDFNKEFLKNLSITLNLSTQRRLISAFSPSHSFISIEQAGDNQATAVLSESNILPQANFEFAYSVSQEEFGLWVLTHRLLQKDGFFLLLVEPKQDFSQARIIDKFFTFVIDTSGSMTGIKIEQAKAAASFSISHLNPDDFFNIIQFNSIIERFQPEPIRATAENVKKALDYISRLRAGGSTNINGALTSALTQRQGKNTANIIMFLTDGLPTAGETNPDNILTNIRNANIDDVSIFVFGVGSDVDPNLLENIALQNNGLAVFVSPEESIDEVITNFFLRVSNPVLTDVSLSYGTIKVFDFFPRKPMDIFMGTQLMILGRYSDAGIADITLSGKISGVPTSFNFKADFSLEERRNEFIPRIWAKRKIDSLLQTLKTRRLVGGDEQEIINQIVALSLEFGIQTPFTSFGGPPVPGDRDVPDVLPRATTTVPPVSMPAPAGTVIPIPITPSFMAPPATITTTIPAAAGPGMIPTSTTPPISPETFQRAPQGAAAQLQALLGDEFRVRSLANGDIKIEMTKSSDLFFLKPTPFLRQSAPETPTGIMLDTRDPKNPVIVVTFADGTQQGFHPTYANPVEFRDFAQALDGVSNVFLNADGGATVLLKNGIRIRAWPDFLAIPASKDELPGIKVKDDGTVLIVYSNGIKQVLFVDIM